MRKIIVLLAVLVLFLAAPLKAEDMQASGNFSADALVYIGPGSLFGIAIATDATNAVTVSIYDNTTNSGKLLVPTFVVSTSATDRVKSFFVYPAIEFKNGVYVDITCAGTVGYELYKRK